MMNVLRHVLLVGVLVVLFELIRFFANIVEPASAAVISSEIYEGSSSRGAGSPVVLITYEFTNRGVRRTATDLYQPKPPWVGRVAWTVQERAAAQRYVAERPPGRAIRIEVSQYFPWISRVINDDEAAAASNNLLSWWTTCFGVIALYCVGVMGKLVLRSLRVRRSR